MDIQIDVPNGVSGDWKVGDFEISEKDAEFENMRAVFHPGGRFVRAGKFKRLTYRGHLIMSNTPAEIQDHLSFIYEARRGEHILINGLGLEVVVKQILDIDAVKSVTIIEKSEDVIRLVAPTYLKDKRVTIIHADAFEWKPPKGQRYSAVWHDIWDSICADNLPEMTKLHRKYGRRTNWQGSLVQRAVSKMI